MKEDALHRLADVWATGEAGSSLGFETTRLYDEITRLKSVFTPSWLKRESPAAAR